MQAPAEEQAAVQEALREVAERAACSAISRERSKTCLHPMALR